VVDNSAVCRNHALQAKGLNLLLLKDVMKKMKIMKIKKMNPLTVSTMQDYAHASSHDIARFRSVMIFQLNTVDSHIVELQAALKDAHAEHSRIVAVLDGLKQTIEKR
jgi:hypothetical protein